MSLSDKSPADRARLFSVAPMMDCTDRHERFLLRRISHRCLLYTEMLTSAAILHGDRERLLGFDASEHPLALQIGGSDPRQMAQCAQIGEDWGYDEVNMNVGCPSDRVQAGQFGACLMARPELVAECIAKMSDAVEIPLTVKTRIGVDDRDSFDDLCSFVATVASAGCSTFVVHARKAWLHGLSPRENRTVPPLNYDRVYAMKRVFPELTIVINGGISDISSAQEHLQHVDGVMVGRAAYSNPFGLAEVDAVIFGEQRGVTRREVLSAYLNYCETQLAAGHRLGRLARHLVGLFQGQPRARAWRRHISEHAHRPGAGLEVLRDAAEFVLETSI